MAMWDERNCQSLEMAAREFEPGFSRLRARCSSRYATEPTVKEKDLGVTISVDMKVLEQCGDAASKGNQILGLNMRNITYKETS